MKRNHEKIIAKKEQHNRKAKRYVVHKITPDNQPIMSQTTDMVSRFMEWEEEKFQFHNTYWKLLKAVKDFPFDNFCMDDVKEKDLHELFKMFAVKVHYKDYDEDNIKFASPSLRTHRCWDKLLLHPGEYRRFCAAISENGIATGFDRDNRHFDGNSLSTRKMQEKLLEHFGDSASEPILERVVSTPTDRIVTIDDDDDEEEEEDEEEDETEEARLKQQQERMQEEARKKEEEARLRELRLKEQQERMQEEARKKEEEARLKEQQERMQEEARKKEEEEARLKEQQERMQEEARKKELTRLREARVKQQQERMQGQAWEKERNRLKEVEARKKEDARLKELEARKKEDARLREDARNLAMISAEVSRRKEEDAKKKEEARNLEEARRKEEEENMRKEEEEARRNEEVQRGQVEESPMEEGGQGGESPLEGISPQPPDYSPMQEELEEEEYDEPLPIPSPIHSPIRPFINSPFAVNERIKANYWSNRKKAKQFPGTITRVNEKNTYDILYDDRTVAKRVPERYIQKLEDEEEEDSVVDATPETNPSESSTIIPHWSTLATSDDANDDFCTVCKKGGILICCDHCHRSYHKGCAEILRQFKDEIPEDYDFKCAQCKHKEGIESAVYMPDMVFKRPACERCSKAKEKCIYYTAQGPCDKCAKNGLVCDTNEFKRRGRRPSGGGSSRKKARRGESPSQGEHSPLAPPESNS